MKTERIHDYLNSHTALQQLSLEKRHFRPIGQVPASFMTTILITCKSLEKPCCNLHNNIDSYAIPCYALHVPVQNDIVSYGAGLTPSS